MQPIPRGLEVLVKKAVVDAAFREALLEERADAAARIGLVLEPAERDMLATISRRQLERVIGRTRVPAAARAAFLGYTAAVMLAALTPAAYASERHATTGINPDLEEKKPQPREGTGSIAGTCLEVGGYPADNVRVEVLGTTYTAVTSPDGFFKIDDIPPGMYDVRVSGGAYGAKTLKNVLVGADDVTNVEFVLEVLGEGGARPDIP